VVVRLVASGSVSDFDSGKKAAVGGKIASAAGVRPEDVEVAVTAASVLLEVSVATAGEETEKVRTSLAARLATASLATSLLQDVGVAVEATRSATETAGSEPLQSSVAVLRRHRR